MSIIKHRQAENHRKQIAQLTRKIQKSSPTATLNLISQSAAIIEDSHIKEWLLRFKKTFQSMEVAK